MLSVSNSLAKRSFVTVEVTMLSLSNNLAKRSGNSNRAFEVHE